MAKENFDKWYVRALVYEDGNVDDPKDPGGRTSDGVTQNTYNIYRDARGKPRRDVYNLNNLCKAGDAEALQERREIYKQYWDRIHGDELPGGVDYVVADGSLNSGPSQSAKWLQRALGLPHVDGEIGPATIAAAGKAPDDDLLVVDICSRRLAFMKTLKTWKRYQKGWGARVANCQKIGTAWASGSIGPDPVAVSAIGGNVKASPLDVAQPLIPVSVTQIATTAGTVATTAGGAASQVQPVAAMFPDSAGKYVLAIAGALTLVAVIANVISTSAQKRADKARSAETSEAIDTDADSVVASVHV